MKRVMKVWSQISSFVVILSAIIGIIYSFSDEIFGPLTVILIILISLAIFYIPLFYFAWTKGPKSKSMRIWSKIVTILFLVLLVIDIFRRQDINSTWLLSSLVFILSLVPLFYYGWKN